MFKFICVALISLGFQAHALANTSSKTFTTQTFKNYAELKHMLLTHMGAAKTRIWLATDYLSDNDLSSALYFAKRRKVDVQVLLNEVSAHARLSRLKYLFDQNLPVRAKESFKSLQAPTVLLIDDSLVYFNTELDFRQENTEFIAHSASKAIAKRYMQEFAACKKDIQPFAALSEGEENSDPENTTLEAKSPGATGKPTKAVYRYSKKYSTPPAGVAVDLPPTPVYEKNKKAGLKYSE